MNKSPNRVLALAVGLIIVLVAVAAVVSSTRSTLVIDKSKPAWAVQNYLKAFLSGRNADAAKMISPESECTVVDVDRAYIIDNARVVLISTNTNGNTAEVRVRVEYPLNGPFGDSSTEDHTFRLTDSNGSWMLTGIPWPLYNCGLVAK